MRNLKKFLAMTLAATMVMGNSVMILAQDTNSTSVEGTGTYEGDELDYPVNSITLPTLEAATYSYLTDPNGLIEATQEAKYTDCSFDSGKLWFLSAEKTYTKDSAAVKVTSENANAIDVSVKLEVSNKDSVSTGVGISSDKTFASDTNANLYFAIVDTDATASKKADVPLTSMTEAVTMTKTIAGVPGNYELQYDNSAYSYKKLATGDTGFTDWNSFEFKLEGAINTAGTWDGITTLPTLKVTWSWADHKETPTVSFSTDRLLTVNGLSEDYTYVSAVLSYTASGATKTYNFGSGTTWSPSAPTGTTTGTVTGQLGTGWGSILAGQTVTVTLTYKDNTGDTAVNKTVTCSTTFPASN